MVKDYWYIFALSAVISMVTISFNNYLVICLFCFWLFYLFSYKKINSTILVLALLSFFFFFYYLPTPDTFISSELDIDRTNFYGEVVSPIIQTDKKVEFTFQDQLTEKPILVLYFINEEKKEHVSAELQYGATCRINGSLSIPEGARNPHQFDYQLYLLKKGISHQIILPTLDDIHCENNSSFLQLIYSFRTNLLKITSEKLHPDTASWIHALVLGHDALIDDDLIELFQRWSLSHLLAISGLHIGIVVGLIYLILVRFSITTKEKAQWMMLFFLPIYAILAGSQPSVWRASLMIMFVILLNKIKLKYNYTDIISIIFLILIISDKHIVYHIGFQLSFAVTFGLILSSKWLSQSKTNVERILQISFVSQMIILPLQIHYFYTFQPLSIILNVIIVPYFSLFVIPSMFILLLLIKLPDIFIRTFEIIFLSFHNLVIDFIMIVDKYANFPFIIGEIPLHFTIIYYALFIFMMIYLEKREQMKSLRYGIFLVAYLIIVSIRPYFSPVGTVTMLDIGQGDAFVIELPFRKGVFFIDAGASFTFPDFQPSDRVFKQIIRPYLYGRGIDKIDAIFISHDDLDHNGSIAYMLKELNVDELIVSRYYYIDEATRIEWEEANVTLTRADFNEKIIRKSQAFHVLSPERDKNDANENSLVLYTELGRLSWLFTGDIGKATERDIGRNFDNLSIDVLKVGHHGSNSSTDKMFVQEIVPKIALISAGVNNSYGHPTDEVIQTLTDENIIIYRTDLQGAVQYHFKDNQDVFSTFLKTK